MVSQMDAEMERRQEEVRLATIRQLQERATRRLGRQVIGRAFTTWLDGYLDDKYRERQLQRTVAQLRKPGLLGAFGWWKDEWEEAEREAAAAAAREELEARVAANASLSEDLNRAQAEAEAAQGKLATLEDEMNAIARAEGERRRVEGELAKTAQELSLERTALAEERAALVALRIEMETTRLAMAESRDKETQAVEAKRAAEVQATQAVVQADSLTKVDAEVRALAEERLRTLLEEQRASLDKVLVTVRDERDETIALLRADKAALEARLLRMERALATGGGSLRDLSTEQGRSPGRPRSPLSLSSPKGEEARQQESSGASGGKLRWELVRRQQSGAIDPATFFKPFKLSSDLRAEAKAKAARDELAAAQTALAEMMERRMAAEKVKAEAAEKAKAAEAGESADVAEDAGHDSAKVAIDNASVIADKELAEAVAAAEARVATAQAEVDKLTHRATSRSVADAAADGPVERRGGPSLKAAARAVAVIAR